MPGFDRTGPRRFGPRTGRSMGYCPPGTGIAHYPTVYGNFERSGFGRVFRRDFGRGFGKGFGRGFGRGATRAFGTAYVPYYR